MTQKQWLNAWLLVNESTLYFRPNAKAWNMLECVEHLILYNAYYIPAIEKAQSKAIPPQPNFTSGRLGNFFWKTMAKDAQLNPMKTVASKNPIMSQLKPEKLLQLQKQLLEQEQLLAAAAQVNLSRPRIPITLTPLIRLQLGDVWLFLLEHQQRHFLQMQRLQQNSVLS